MSDDGLPHVVIIGGGFAGLYAARSLRRVPCRITLLDRRNHHLFQPMLYQVATASLSPAQIAAPIRRVLASQRNCRVLLAEARSIDPDARVIHLADADLSYDLLVLATGVRHAYFGHGEWEQHAPGLKTIEDALEIRRRFLLAFERAERADDPELRRAELTFVIVGGGPTGVEMAGAFAEIARRSIPAEFRAINTASARVVLVEAGDRVLGAFAPDLSESARRQLQALGVEVRLNTRVEHVDAAGVRLNDGQILRAGTVVWAAGIRASSLGAALGAPTDSAGRVRVLPDLSIPDHPEVFVCGDLAHLDDSEGRIVPGVAPAAMQMGRHAALIIARELEARRAGRPAPPREPFRYVNKGELATIGRARAVGVLGFGINAHLTGFVAWALWALVHVSYLIGFRNRLIVLIDWAWAYLVFERGARLITGDVASTADPNFAPAAPRSAPPEV
ncbi:MAG: NAD(P)/FAD-dependent oxidoreductase [Phycisphaerales bacterium]